MILAVDLGSTNFKAALFSEQGHRLSTVSRPLPYTIHTLECAEMDPEAVAATFFQLIDDATGSAKVGRSAIQCMAITSQAQTFCICDSQGRVQSPFLGWTDLRAAAEATELTRSLGEDFHTTSGFPEISPLQTLSKVLWWKRNRGFPADHRVVPLPTFLAMRLGAPFVVDDNLAAMSGFYSIPEGRWWERATEETEVTGSQLGKVVHTGTTIQAAQADRPEGFCESLEIVLAGNDHTAGAVGAGCEAGRPILTLGTAGVFYRHAGQSPGPYSSGGLWGPFPGGGYYELLCLSHACSALDWADEFLFGHVDSPRFARHAAKARISDQSPFFYPQMWGSASAWSGGETKNEKAYAVLEGIAFALRDLVEEGSAPDFSDKEGVLLGGGAQLDFWSQLVADIFQHPFVRGTADGLDGAARLAGATIPPSTTEKWFHPGHQNPELLSNRFLNWKKWLPNPAKPGQGISQKARQ